MQKSVISTVKDSKTQVEGEWLDLEHLARVEVTSENADFPVESVFAPGPGPGWRAAGSGRQTIRLIFGEPHSIRRIRLEFSEAEATRLQEFTLRWAVTQESTLKEIVRQQWNFSPQGSTSEIEDYRVDLAGASVLELTLNPDLSSGTAVASLQKWQIA